MTREQNLSHIRDTLSETTSSDAMAATQHPAHRRWRDYRTESGRRPVKEFLAALPIDDRAAIAAAMKDIQIHGNAGAHQLRGDIYEVRAYAGRRQYRVLYATEGKSDQVLLSVHAIVKTTRSIPLRDIDLTVRRLRNWRSRRRST